MEMNAIPERFKMTELGPLPEEWTVVPLQKLNSQKKVSLNPANFPDEIFEYYSIPNYQNSKKPSFEQGASILSQKILLNNGAVLFGKLNPRVEKVWKVESDTQHRKIGSTEWIPIFPDNEKVDSGFLYYVEWSKYVMPVAKTLVTGSTPSRQRVAPASFYEIKIPLPPLPEQRSIASVLSTAQHAKEKTDAVITATKALKKSLMKHLFAYGPVSLEEVENVPLKETEIGLVPEAWDGKGIGEAIRGTQYGISLRGNQQGQYPILRMNNLIDGRVDTSDLQYVDLDEGNFKKFQLNKGDILFNRTNSFELVGKSALFDSDDDFIFASYLIRVVPNTSQLVPEYLNYYLNWDTTQRRLKMLASRGVSQSNINATKLRGFSIHYPPLFVQQRIASILSTVDEKIEKEETKKKALDELFKTLLSILMTGKIRVNHLEV